MRNLYHNFLKILLSAGFISAGIGLPMIMSTGHFLECQRTPTAKDKTADTRVASVTCEILEMGGGTLFTKGNKVLDQQTYDDIRLAEVVTVKAPLTLTTEVDEPNSRISRTSTSVQEISIEKLILVIGRKKQAVEFRFPVGTVSSISSQINNLIKDDQAPKFSIEIGQPSRVPQIMGWVFITGGLLSFLAKSSSPLEN
jgi:hypothetical protein